MLNEDLFKAMTGKFGIENMLRFSEMLSHMYTIIYINNPEDCSECKFERDWWEKRYIELLVNSLK
jgi:hypothetical protein